MAKKIRGNVEIISSVDGQSGLRLTNLPSSTTQTVFNWILGIDAAGDVIKIDATTIVAVTVSPVSPSSPVLGQQRLNTSVSPSELMIWNGTAWEVSNDEVQHYADSTAFPATGDEDVLYIDDDSDAAYLWDSTTSAYISITGSSSSGVFYVSDGTNTQSVWVSDTIVFQENVSIADVLQFKVSATDIVEIQAAPGHTAGQTIVSNGTKMVYQSVGRKYSVTITPVANTAYTVTHNLNTTDIIVQAYDVALNELAFVEVINRTANAVNIISTTTDNLRIIIFG